MAAVAVAAVAPNRALAVGPGVELAEIRANQELVVLVDFRAQAVLMELAAQQKARVAKQVLLAVAYKKTKARIRQGLVAVVDA